MSTKHRPPSHAQMVFVTADGDRCAACNTPHAPGTQACLVKREGLLCRACWEGRAKSPPPAEAALAQPSQGPARVAAVADGPFPEACPKCHAPAGEKCRNYKGQGKQTCPQRDGRKPMPAEEVKEEFFAETAKAHDAPPVPKTRPVRVLADAAGKVLLKNVPGFPAALIPPLARVRITTAADVVAAAVKKQCWAWETYTKNEPAKWSYHVMRATPDVTADLARAGSEAFAAWYLQHSKEG